MNEVAGNAIRSASEAPFVLSEKSGAVLWLTLNRPQQRNPLSSAMLAALHTSITEANEDASVRVMVVSGSGPVFSAGHDLREMSRRGDENNEQFVARARAILEQCAQMMLAIVHSPKAIIACVQGTATAAGCQLVSACDLAVASADAHFCTPGVNIGAFCTTPLVGIGRNIHRKHAMELALTGDLLPAEDAMRFGLVNRVVAADRVHATTEALAQQIATKSCQGIRSGKEAFYRQLDMPIEEAFAYANEAMLQGLMTSDAAEGTAAFLDKRPPHWRDA